VTFARRCQSAVGGWDRYRFAFEKCWTGSVAGKGLCSCRRVMAMAWPRDTMRVFLILYGGFWRPFFRDIGPCEAFLRVFRFEQFRDLAAQLMNLGSEACWLLIGVGHALCAQHGGRSFLPSSTSRKNPGDFRSKPPNPGVSCWRPRSTGRRLRLRSNRTATIYSTGRAAGGHRQAALIWSAVGSRARRQQRHGDAALQALAPEPTVPVDGWTRCSQ